VTLNPVGYTTDTQTLRRYSQHTYTHVHVGESTSVRYGHAVYAPAVRDIPGVLNINSSPLRCVHFHKACSQKHECMCITQTLYEYTDMPTTPHKVISPAAKLKHECHTDCALSANGLTGTDLQDAKRHEGWIHLNVSNKGVRTHRVNREVCMYVRYCGRIVKSTSHSLTHVRTVCTLSMTTIESIKYARSNM
jgi:hypothetical protein